VSNLFSVVAYVRWCGNKFPEPVPSNERKVTFTEPLLNNDGRDTHADIQTEGRNLWAQLP
jgi:hypothetical protein